MSDANGSGDERDADAQREDAEYTPTISALPPRVMMQEENQVEVSASPAFQCLDDVSNAYQ